MSEDCRATLSRSEWLVLALLAVANLIPIWAFHFFPGQDTPNHLYGVEVARTIWDGTAPAAIRSTFELALAFKSNVLFQGLMLGLCRLGLSVGLAHRLILSAYALGLPAATLFAVRVANPRAASLALLIVPLVWNWFILQGLYNYTFSLIPAIVWLGLVARDGGRPRPAAQVAIMACSVLVYLGHAGTFLVGLLVCALRVLFPGDGVCVPLRRRIAGARPLVIALLPAIAVAAAGLRGVVGGVHGFREATLSSWEAYGLLEAIGAFFVEFAMRYRPVDLLFLGPPLVALLVIPVWAGWQQRRARLLDSPPLTPRRWPLLAAGLLTALYLALPHIVLGSDACPRVRPFIPLCLMLYEGVALSQRARRRLLALVVACGVGGLAVLMATFAQLNTALNDFTSATAQVPEGSRLYPMVFDQRGPSLLVRPFLHAWGYYGLERHVVTPYAFAWHETRFPYRYRQLPIHGADSAFPSDGEEEPYALTKGWMCEAVRRYAPSVECAAVRADAEARLARLGSSYDFVLTWAAPPDFTGLLDRLGFTRVHAQGQMSLFKPPAAGSGSVRP